MHRAPLTTLHKYRVSRNPSDNKSHRVAMDEMNEELESELEAMRKSSGVCTRAPVQVPPPADASDLQTLEEAREEVARLRAALAS
eukprot:NODE_8254_length_418_cov_13.585366_g7386_i0.p3 GENE.NODE_8254_length_418_cov_13.585366_g7386_i0~~NODE_8254_length_418_cov_13.585366_g7386_i0.p3  ORF type:complete len:85 (+),score=33.49 NODE_8254_length_418_cov_13.585366_g7386_i0:57-311(+)